MKNNKAFPVTVTQMYTPVVFTAGSHTGELAIQKTNQNGDLLRSPGSYDPFCDPGEWEICDKWSESQEREFRETVESLKTVSIVTVKVNDRDKITRIIISTIY